MCCILCLSGIGKVPFVFIWLVFGDGVVNKPQASVLYCTVLEVLRFSSFNWLKTSCSKQRCKENITHGEDKEKRELYYTLGGNVNQWSYYRKQFLKKKKNNLKRKLAYDPLIPLLGIYLKKAKTWIQKVTYTPVFMCMLSPSVVSNSLWSHGLQPARLLCPWGFSRQESWSGLPCPPPGDLPNPGLEPRSPTLQVDPLQSEPPGKPSVHSSIIYNSQDIYGSNPSVHQ